MNDSVSHSAEEASMQGKARHTTPIVPRSESDDAHITGEENVGWGGGTLAGLRVLARSIDFPICCNDDK
jgi:hypothetical protein